MLNHLAVLCAAADAESDDSSDVSLIDENAMSEDDDE